MNATPESASLPVEARAVRQWLGLAVGVLLLAGGFALLLVIGRMPPFDRFITDPGFFRRALVVHVNLALVFWFYSFVAALLFLLPGAGRSAAWTRWGAQISIAGVALLGIASLIEGAQPILSNYIPMIDHPLFAAGHLLFGGGIMLSFADRRLLGTDAPWFPLDPAAIPGIRATGLALVLAALTFASSWLGRPVGVTPEVYWELLHWGGGHVLQLVSVAAMVSVWLVLLGSALGRSPVSRPVSSGLFALLVLPWSVAPLLPISGTQSTLYHAGFTDLMRWGLFPAVTIFLVLCVGALVGALRRGELGARDLLDPRIAGFAVSAGLTGLGFVLGAMIDGSNTIVPAHYHAAIGAVTAAFMAASWLLFDAVGWPVPTPRLRRLAGWQPIVYGTGQLVFATGFAIAGAYGMARKAYGAEQAGRGLAETIGLGVMGVGGLVAVLGGLLFLRIAVACVWSARAADARRATVARRLTPSSTPSSASASELEALSAK